MQYSKGIFLFILILFLPNSTYSQETSYPESQVFFVSGYSPTSIRFLGKTPDATTSILKLEYRKKLKASFKNAPIYYQVGIIPYIVYNYPKRDDGGRKDIAKGLGVSPFGFGTTNFISNRLGYSLNSYGGFILMDKKFPTDEGRNLNYTFSFSMDAVIKANDFFSFSLGYKFHHISNAQTGTENPGLDSNFITISLILSK